jgi:PAB-dependent poly(A)-specific ribonuclease subunit 3
MNDMCILPFCALQLEDLSHEMENGRLFRLATKLSFVTDRPAEGPGGHGSAQHQSAYADSGDKYLLGLFRDFVFHQGELEQGRVLDWGHVVETLNKVRSVRMIIPGAVCSS